MAGKNTYYGGIYKARPYAIAANTASTVIDLSESNVYHITLSTDTVLTLNNPTTTNYIFHISQSGYNDITFPDNIKWHDGAPPVLSPEPGALDIITLSFDGTIYYGTTSLNHRSGLLLDEFEGAVAAYSLRALTTASTDYIPLAGDYGAEVAYSLRQVVSSYTGPVVRVRRSSDNAEKDFTATEVKDGTAEDWVNEDITQYNYSTATQMVADFASVGGADSVDTIDGQEALKFTTNASSGTHFPYRFNVFGGGGECSISFDYYIPSTNTDIDGIQMSDASNDIGATQTTQDAWTSVTVTGTLVGVSLYIFSKKGPAKSFTGNGTDVFYIKNLVVTQTTADGLVTTWYDQSGNDNHATQATASNQPKLVDAGVFITENGKPAIDFDGVSHFLKASASITDYPVTNIIVQRNSATNTGHAWSLNNDSSSTEYYTNSDYSSSNIAFHNVRNSANVFFSTAWASAIQNSIFAWSAANNNHNFTINGGSVNSSTNVTSFPNANNIAIGRLRFSSTAFFYDGIIQELIVWNSDQSANRKKIEYEINAHYGIYTQWDRKSLVRVRRSSDNAERDFTQREIIDGTLEDWVNEEYVYYESDFSSGVDSFSPQRGVIDGNIDAISGVDDVLRFITDNSDGLHRLTKSIVRLGQNTKISFEYYIPSTNTDIDGIRLTTYSNEGILDVSALDTWTQAETLYNTSLNTTIQFIGLKAGATSFLDNGTDVFYLKNIVVTQTTADGHVVTWYDQSLNDNHAVQTTAANQPKIVDAGVLVIKNSKPGIEFDGVDDHFSDLSSVMSASVNGLMISVHNTNDGVITFDSVQISGTSPVAIPIVGSNQVSYAHLTNTRVIVATSDNFYDRQILVSRQNYNGDHALYVDSILIDSQVDAVSYTDLLKIGRVKNGAGFSYFDNVLQEVIVFNDDRSLTQADIETNINKHYKIY